jgi:thiol-disulfide isomerase/thioredoxin
MSCTSSSSQGSPVVDGEEKAPMYERVQTVADIPEYDYEGLEPLLHRKDDNVYVVNFWATWCKPCVAELPYFEEIYDQYSGSNVEIILVSLDFPQQFETRLVPFIQENQIKSEVVILNDPKENEWIDKISKEWSGAIPATLVYNRNLRQFYEQSFHSAQEIENIVESFIQ